VITGIAEQSPDISAGVSHSLEQRSGSSDPLDSIGAGDQGMMVGYASRESEPYFPGSFMPLPVQIAHTLARRLAEVRKAGARLLRPDGKTQVSLRYEGDRPAQISSVLISTQHSPEATTESLRELLTEQVLRETLPGALCPGGDASAVHFLCNPSGRFVRGGPEADSGLTGRKLIVDTYGGAARHGGGSFSGKDPSKVDRSASYYARYVAKNLVAAGAAERLELQVSYAIGQAKPFSLMLESFGSGRQPDTRLEQLLREGGIFDFRPAAIIANLKLRETRYLPVAAYGHFGRTDLDLPWERLDKVDAVRQALGL
jgi:S-adenosylmethionine synthetase